MNDLRCSYVLPLRWESDAGRLPELTGYLRRLRRTCQVIVVDGSPPDVFRAHRLAWGDVVTHCRPDRDLAFLNGKVNGVLTGVRRARGEYVVIADDDVRYDAAALDEVLAGLCSADVVVPQNHFDPLPWHARWDTARSLLNRAFAADFPGTVAMRRRTLERAGGYDGNVLFENLELLRTLRASGSRISTARSIFVRRIPPSSRGFWSQRVRQAYDSLAQPGRMAAELSIVPAIGLLARRRAGVLGAAAMAIMMAEVGRRRGGGAAVYPASAALWAPLWVAERGICSWVALATRFFRGGVKYAGSRLAVAAHSRADLEMCGGCYRDLESESPLDARKRAATWRPSQNGLIADFPHRQSATVERRASITSPS